MNSVGINTQQTQIVKFKSSKELSKPKEMTEKPKEGMSTTSKVLIGASALAAVVIGGIALHNKAAAKKAFNEGFNAIEHTKIKETPASRNAQAIIDRVENLKAQENSAIRNYPYASMNWDAKPIPREQALFEHKFPTPELRDKYISPALYKDFEALEQQGYKINVEHLKNGKTEIEYIYPEESPIKSKVVTGKIADLEKGYDWNAKDSKQVSLKLKENDKKTYTVISRNNFTVGETPYEFKTYGVLNGNATYGSRPSINKETLLENIISGTQNGNSEEGAKALRAEFQKELGV